MAIHKSIVSGLNEFQGIHEKKAETNQKIVDVVFRYIDRMNDVCEDFDPADKIIDQFVSDVMPIINEI